MTKLFLFLIVIIVSLHAMDQAPQKPLTQEEALAKLEDLKNSFGMKYYDPYAVYNYKEYSPPRYVIYMQRQIKQDPRLAIKDIKYGDEPLIIKLAEDDECYEVLKFMLDHGAPAHVNTKWSGQNVALYKALWAKQEPALKNARLLLERKAPAQFEAKLPGQEWYVREPEKNPRIQLLMEFGAKIDEFVVSKWCCSGLP